MRLIDHLDLQSGRKYQHINILTAFETQFTEAVLPFSFHDTLHFMANISPKYMAQPVMVTTSVSKTLSGSHMKPHLSPTGYVKDQ